MGARMPLTPRPASSASTAWFLSHQLSEALKGREGWSSVCVRAYLCVCVCVHACAQSCPPQGTLFHQASPSRLQIFATALWEERGGERMAFYSFWCNSKRNDGVGPSGERVYVSSLIFKNTSIF